MTPHFEAALKYVFANEGGYSNHPDDSGGPTNFGITQATLAQWRGAPVSAEEVLELTPGQASIIYYERYWKPLGCNRMHLLPVATAIFDAGVLFGIGAATTCAQRALRADSFQELVVDGHIGPWTLNALNAVAPSDFIRVFQYTLLQRVDRIIEKHPNYAVFRGGWVSRVEKLKKLVEG